MNVRIFDQTVLWRILCSTNKCILSIWIVIKKQREGSKSGRDSHRRIPFRRHVTHSCQSHWQFLTLHTPSPSPSTNRPKRRHIIRDQNEAIQSHVCISVTLFHTETQLDYKAPKPRMKTRMHILIQHNITKHDLLTRYDCVWFRIRGWRFSLHHTSPHLHLTCILSHVVRRIWHLSQGGGGDPGQPLMAP